SQVDVQTKQILLAHLGKEKIAFQPINFSSLTFILALLNGCPIKEDLFFQTDLETLSFSNEHFPAIEIVKKPRNGNNFLNFSQLSKLNLSQFVEKVSELLMNRYCQARFNALQSVEDLNSSLENFILKNISNVLTHLMQLKQ